MGFRFFPTIENRKGLLKSINVIPNDDFAFFRSDGKFVHELLVDSGRIKDVFWDQRKDALIVKRAIKINDPAHLYGKDGIACSNSNLGLAILWSNSSTSMAGCILPKDGTEIANSTGWFAHFEHVFQPGEVFGTIEFKIVIYLKNKADTVMPDEMHLNNNVGIVLGELETYRLEVSDDTVPFPITVENNDSDALWWVDFFSWDDPGEDGVFGPSSFMVTVNSRISSSYPCVVGNNLKNSEMLYEIAASVYAMLYKKLNNQQFTDMLLKKGNPGSISAELSRLYYLCKNGFDYNSDFETIHKCMQEVIRREAKLGITPEEVDNA